jgi:hypothetical protein
MTQDINSAVSQSLSETDYVVPKRNKKIGLILIIGPIVGLISVLVSYSVIAFVLRSGGSGSETSLVVAQIINVILGLLGVVCVVGIIIGIPMGILFIGKKELVDGAKYDERSGKKEASVVPDEIKGWNWGAAGLTWVWGVYHGVFISLLAFIPLVNIIMFIVLGMKGSEWAWKARKWESVEIFVSSQKKWKPFGILFFVLMMLRIIF